MGQYFIPVNYDKKQFLHPHKLGDGLKIVEFAGSTTSAALTFLLANPLSQSSDFRMPNDLQLPYDSKQLAGSWAGDRIEILGDYHDNENHPVSYSTISNEEDEWEDISILMWNILQDNTYNWVDNMPVPWQPPDSDRRYWENA